MKYRDMIFLIVSLMAALLIALSIWVQESYPQKEFGFDVNIPE